MANKYLDSNGVAYMWEKIKTLISGKQDKETGKGLSSNDYTSTEKTKLAGIETGAQVNVLEGIQAAGNTITPTNKIANIPAMTGASSGAAGAVGLVPAPASGDQTKFLRGDGSWQTVSSGSSVSPSSTTPKMDGTASTGSEDAYARGDHVHPKDTSKANLASPTFTGTPKAPTATAGTNNTQIATTAFVTSAISSAMTGAAMFKGTISAETAITGLSDYTTGWYWVIDTAGSYVGETCEVGDMIYCISDRGSAYSASDFSVVQTNLDMVAITNSEIDTICV